MSDTPDAVVLGPRAAVMLGGASDGVRPPRARGYVDARDSGANRESARAGLEERVERMRSSAGTTWMAGSGKARRAQR